MRAEHLMNYFTCNRNEYMENISALPFNRCAIHTTPTVLALLSSLPYYVDRKARPKNTHRRTYNNSSSNLLMTARHTHRIQSRVSPLRRSFSSSSKWHQDINEYIQSWKQNDIYFFKRELKSLLQLMSKKREDETIGKRAKATNRRMEQLQGILDSIYRLLQERRQDYQKMKHQCIPQERSEETKQLRRTCSVKLNQSEMKCLNIFSTYFSSRNPQTHWAKEHMITSNHEMEDLNRKPLSDCREKMLSQIIEIFQNEKIKCSSSIGSETDRLPLTEALENASEDQIKIDSVRKLSDQKSMQENIDQDSLLRQKFGKDSTNKLKTTILNEKQSDLSLLDNQNVGSINVRNKAQERSNLTGNGLALRKYLSDAVNQCGSLSNRGNRQERASARKSNNQINKKSEPHQNVRSKQNFGASKTATNSPKGARKVLDQNKKSKQINKPAQQAAKSASKIPTLGKKETSRDLKKNRAISKGKKQNHGGQEVPDRNQQSGHNNFLATDKGKERKANNRKISNRAISHMIRSLGKPKNYDPSKTNIHPNKIKKFTDLKTRQTFLRKKYEKRRVKDWQDDSDFFDLEKETSKFVIKINDEKQSNQSISSGSEVSERKERSKKLTKYEETRLKYNLRNKQTSRFNDSCSEVEELSEKGQSDNKIPEGSRHLIKSRKRLSIERNGRSGKLRMGTILHRSHSQSNFAMDMGENVPKTTINLKTPFLTNKSIKIINKLERVHFHEFDLNETKEHIKNYLKKVQGSKKAKQLYKFFLFMESSLKSDLKKKRELCTLDAISLERESRDIKQLVGSLTAEHEIYEGCNTLLEMDFDKTRHRPMEKKYIQKLNHRMIDLMYWNEENQANVDDCLEQISLKEIKNIEL